MIFTKILYYTRTDLSLRRVVLQQLVADLKVTAKVIEMALGYTDDEVFFADLKFSMGMVLARKNL